MNYTSFTLCKFGMLSINMNNNMKKPYVMIHVIKHDMDPNSNINYRRKIPPLSKYTSLYLSYVTLWLDNGVCSKQRPTKNPIENLSWQVSRKNTKSAVLHKVSVGLEIPMI